VKRWGLIAVVVLLVAWGWLRVFAWFDPLSACRIHIDVELLEGDRGAIRSAIDVVRREDPLVYRALCRWVDRIQEERQCDAGDPQADRRAGGADSAGRSRPAIRLRSRGARLLRPGLAGSCCAARLDGGGGPARPRASRGAQTAGRLQPGVLDRPRALGPRAPIVAVR
jgi:hypothetical protein